MATTIDEQTMETLTNMKISTMMSMPNDIVSEILSWLPAKSLLRFRWVCKYWFDLIKESSFVKKHLFRSNCSSRLWGSDYSMFYLTISDQFMHCYIDYTTGLFSHQVTIPQPLKSHILFKILGSCHGLILFRCLLNSYFPHITRLFILNPFTKEYKDIPNVLTEDIMGFERGSYADTLNYGFGYDHTTDDYKVIQVTYYKNYDGNDENKCYFLHVYTLRTNEWRIIGPISYDLLYREKGVFVNGAIYWRNYSKRKIISFDMGKERLEEITNPPVCFNRNLDEVKLEIFEGSLCVMAIIKDPRVYYVEMWVMKDNYCMNNNESSWTKLVRIVSCLPYLYLLYLKPLRFIKSGEILLLKECGSKLFLCDPKDNRLRALDRIWEDEHCTHAVDEAKATYVESLVSLNLGTYTIQEQNE